MVYRSWIVLIVHFDNPNIHSIHPCVFTMSYTRLLATMAIFGTLLLTSVWALGNVMAKQNADAQMRSTNATDTGNMTAADMMMKPGKNITSSINLMNLIGQAIGSKVNVSLSDAATTAEASVGNNSHAVAAYIDEQNGYLVYTVMVIDPSMNFSKVIVDPGNGQVLSSKQISKEEHMRMHGMMGPGIMGHNMMMGPPGRMIGGEKMMMGPMHQGMMTGGYPG
jgi:uncharacterized membrane protein YkoI